MCSGASLGYFYRTVMIKTLCLNRKQNLVPRVSAAFSRSLRETRVSLTTRGDVKWAKQANSLFASIDSGRRLVLDPLASIDESSGRVEE